VVARRTAGRAAGRREGPRRSPCRPRQRCKPAAAFVDGGSHLVTLDDNGRGYLWNIAPGSWARWACEVAGRMLTQAEWSDALPERKYAPACAAR
jgi:hypothetical protein